MKLITALRSERLKTKGTASFYLAFLGAALVPAILQVNFLFDGSDLDKIRKDPLNKLPEMIAEINGVLFFPLFVILICTLLPQIEYRNNTWKQVFTSPQTKSDIYLAKFINVNLHLLLFMAASLVFMWVAVVITHFVEPSLNLLHQPFDAKGFLVRTGNIYITVLAMCTFQFWLGLRYKNFIVPIAVGFVLWIIGLMMVLEYHTSFMNYFPYSLQAFPFSAKYQSAMPQVLRTSAGYALLFFILGFLDFRSKRMNA